MSLCLCVFVVFSLQEAELGVVDNFERALEHAPDMPNQVVEGLRVIHNQLLGILQGQGVTPFRSVGEQFNPALHEAIGAVNTDEFEPGTVFDEYQRGYMLNDELLRPARVRVVQ